MTPQSSAAPLAGAPADDAAHLLVVDDDRRIRALLSRFLTDQGYRVTTAGDAAEAMACSKASPSTSSSSTS